MSNGTLYIVSTPIGNLEDITFRAVNILKKVNFIASEDTRRSAILLNHYRIKKSLISYFEHNEITKNPEIINRIICGENCALITDAGTPGISDPAYKLIRNAIDNSVRVESIPGPSAVLTALTSSGLPTDRFLFEGFLPPRKNRKSRLEKLNNEDATLIIFERYNRIQRTLYDIKSILGDRPAVIARELTKLHEELLRGTISELLIYLEQKRLKGECVILIGKNKKSVYFN
ncbi:MAG: 16S rRNA (cytidine(1402)-2'-O)-methyltransferase [Candidatus Marinimicrobia bacterium]|nr:16S rRNA (cytidine(1402)-2'-O)-methyltransferase [Candidatus Neomarinimicrobiota bacterium]|tara:strand:- start:12242 stop:12934 length:693 start_codon:yes stop_codon:yes gene_type:complete